MITELAFAGFGFALLTRVTRFCGRQCKILLQSRQELRKRAAVLGLPSSSLPWEIKEAEAKFEESTKAYRARQVGLPENSNLKAIREREAYIERAKKFGLLPNVDSDELQRREFEEIRTERATLVNLPESTLHGWEAIIAQEERLHQDTSVSHAAWVRESEARKELATKLKLPALKSDKPKLLWSWDELLSEKRKKQQSKNANNQQAPNGHILAEPTVDQFIWGKDESLEPEAKDKNV